MINKQGIVTYDTQTGKEIPTSWKEMDTAYIQLGPRIFHAIASLGGEYVRKEELAIRTMQNYPKPRAGDISEKKNYTPELESKILDLSKQMDEAIKREDWVTVRALKNEKKRLENKV